MAKTFVVDPKKRQARTPYLPGILTGSPNEDRLRDRFKGRSDKVD